jgi:OPA family glycerol-3-phosphate transporter-like MFS transporter/OPA family sugar phosphate sensor protein UhpC-like MFS transporter
LRAPDQLNPARPDARGAGEVVASAPAADRRPSFPRLLRLFEPAPAAVPLTDPAEIKAQYRYWQRRILVSSIIGYAMFYFVRKNLSIAMPAMGKELGISKANLGLFLTLHGLLYGVSKFANGFAGDRCNARTFMAAGLILSAIVNVFFGLSSAVLTLGLLWMLNGWVQGMGFPPCARLMAHWFSPKELATNFSIWNTSHSIGAGLVVVLCGYLVGFGWRLCFFVPAAMAALCSVALLFMLRDTPPSLGLPEAEGTVQPPASAVAGEAAVMPESFAALMKRVFANPYIWIVSMASFFVYTVRYAVLDWGPTLLSESKGIQLSHAGWMVGAFEVSGVAGMLVSGWLTDKIFGGRGARTCVFSMGLAGLSMLLFWKLPGQSRWVSTFLLCCTGFFIYGPQALVGTVAANLATKRAAATAIGFTGLFGYASTILSGWGLGVLVQHYGWNTGLAALTGMAALGVLLFALAWPAKAHGYAD